MQLPIVKYGDPRLRTKCKPIEKITDEIRQLVLDMIETFDATNGIGIAAPQVGHLLRLFVCRSYIDTADGQWAMTQPQVYINPKLTDHSEETIEDDEGCLSIPGLRGNVIRPLKVTVEALDIHGKSFREELTGYNARIRMHENDHINGVLFIDRLSPKDRKQVEPTLQRIKHSHSANA
ncbi:MAG: peptide deformylase [Chlamydiales bacterium]